MGSRDIARRYAEAGFELAVEQAGGSVDGVLEQLEAVRDAIEEIDDIQVFLAHPLIPNERKIGFLRRAFPDLDPVADGLLRMMIRNQRTDHLDLILEEYRTLLATRAGIAQVDVTTAIPLSAEGRRKLGERLAGLLHGPVNLREEVDSSLIGGLRLLIGGRSIDGSLAGKLERLRTVLEG
ncbi:ATP synthase F1 subunit delta [Candidatus Bipolaricaulota bacterium]|nr:ATP synthase F1 subunit delta [Candidatus Bipolaricaulota bacterium]